MPANYHMSEHKSRFPRSLTFYLFIYFKVILPAVSAGTQNAEKYGSELKLQENVKMLDLKPVTV